MTFLFHIAIATEPEPGFNQKKRKLVVVLFQVKFGQFEVFTFNFFLSAKY